ncbi:FadR/GntR family transcriptional regulator [Aquipuribacter sp. SD81]|uniref:FadR/GntR family transcriptional regulator n=1 Tax=Aquipuribacter sp. SD81 TaxID=3127703 RepID=UPI00301A7EEC
MADRTTQRPREDTGRPARRADAVVDALLEDIVSGELATGQLVPNEAALCLAHGVSRTVVREAVKALESHGLLTVRQGIGTTVTPQEAWNLLEPRVLAAVVEHDEQFHVLDQLVAVRTALESGMAADAARMAGPDDLADLRRMLDELDDLVDDPERMDDADVAFHERIMLASGNQLGRAIVRTVHAEARRSRRYSGVVGPVDRRETNRQHREVLKAIGSGDAAAAERAMAAHIESSWERRRPRNG